jgi:membrane protein implicated in regulation of membrane protease activity
MSGIDWPLAIALVVVFVVMSIVRWRYFMHRMARRKDGATGSTGTTKGTPD